MLGDLPPFPRGTWEVSLELDFPDSSGSEIRVSPEATRVKVLLGVEFVRLPNHALWILIVLRLIRKTKY